MTAPLRIALAAVLVASSAFAQSPTPPPNPHVHEPPPAPQKASPEREYFSDVVLVNQFGEPMRFYSDLLQGKTVVINPFFTSCTGVCPVLSSKMAKIQEWADERLGNEVHLISLSVDPETDTVDRLKEYADRFGAKRGWYLLSGKKENVDWALYRVGQYAENKEAHTNLIIVGNEPAKEWRKVFGLSPAPDIIRVVEDVLQPGE